MFRFIHSVFHEMRLTTWPNRKQSWHDFWMVVEYTAFFTIFVMAFDWVINFALTKAVALLLPLIG